MSIYVLYYLVISILFMLLNKYKFIVIKNQLIFQKKVTQCKIQTRFFMVVASFLLIILIGFRSDHQGIDLYNQLGTGYFYYYKKINDDSFAEILKYFGDQKYANFEIGFVLLCKLIGTLCANQQILLVTSAFLTIVPIGIYIYKNSENKWLSIVLFTALPFFPTILFSAIRQGIAIGIVLFSYSFVKDKKPLLFLLTVAVACTFHSSAVVALAAYPVYHLKLDRKSALIGGVGGLIVIWILREPLFGVLAKLVHNNPVIVRSNSFHLFLALGMLYVVFILLYKEGDYELRGLINILWLATAVQAFSGLHNLASRVTWYFIIVLIVIIPNFLMNANIKGKRIRKVAEQLIGLMAILLGLYNLRHNSMAMAYPYIPFWSK